jgi:hypothetical protein
MGQAAFTVAGQVIGAYFGGPIGSAIGGMIGSAIGGAVFPEQLPQIEGPRLDDTRVQASSHGKAIAILFANNRVAGNLIWATELRETRTETASGGKGGGPQQDTISYSYDVDLAIALGEGEIFAIRRIWINGVLIYDARSATDPIVLATYGNDADAILRAIKASGAGSDNFVFYPGDETQLPDPTIEATEGAGNVPAYRGTSYVVFTRFQLANWGNRIPQFEFEVVTSGTSVRGEQVAAEFHSTPSYRNGVSYLQGDYQPIISDIRDSIRVFSANNEFVDPNVRVYGFDGALITTDTITDWEGGFDTIQIGQVVPQVWIMFDGALCEIDISVAFDFQLRIISDDSNVSINYLLPGVMIGGVAPCADGRHLLVFEADSTIAPYNIINWHLVEYLGTNQAEVVDTGTVDYASATEVTYLNVGLGPIHTANGHFYTVMMESDLRHIWRTRGQEIEVWEIDADGDMSVILSTAAVDFPNMGGVASGTPLSMHCDNGFCVVVGGDSPSGHWIWIYSRLPAITATPVTVGDIVEAICVRVGLDPSQIDVTELTRVSLGFAIGQSMTARAAIEALMRAYNFDAAESGAQIIFRVRDNDPELTLTEEDLGAAVGGSAGVLLTSERGQETDLPNECTVLYSDAYADYARGAQAARRVTTASVEKMELHLPVVMTPDEAAQAADILMYQAWVGRNKRTFATTRAFAKIEPTDTITVQAGNVAANVRITNRKQSDGLIEWSSADVDSAVFTSNATGVPLPLPNGITFPAPTHLQVLDIPALREIDNDAGVYLAAYIPGSGAWPGAAILQAPSFAGPYSRVASIYARASVGQATTILGYYYGGNTFDELNTVDVQMFYGAPSSATATAVLNGANVGIVGDEIIQWKTATDLGNSNYRLSGLLRGRRATEQQMLNHALYDRFVLLDTTGLERLTLANGIIGLTRNYRPVTFGGVENPVFDVAHAHIGGSAIPALVANITATRTTFGIMIRWRRRDRLAWDWADSIELPLNETQERYTIEIFTSFAGVVVRTINDIATNEYLYTVADEFFDFDALGDYPLDTITVKIYQVSSSAGRGFSERRTLSGITNL